MFSFTKPSKTVEEVLSVFTGAVLELQQIAIDKAEEEELIRREIAEKDSLLAMATAERVRALLSAEKIKSFFGGQQTTGVSE